MIVVADELLRHRVRKKLKFLIYIQIYIVNIIINSYFLT